MNHEFVKLREKINSWDVEYIDKILKQYTKYADECNLRSETDYDENKEDIDYMEDCDLKNEVIGILDDEDVMYFTIVTHLIALECWRAMALKLKTTARDLINCRLPDNDWVKIRNIIMTD